MKIITREQLEHLSKEDLIAIILKQSAELEKLKEKVASLEKNSRNSSKPPSSDTRKPLKVSKTSRRKQKRQQKKEHQRTTRRQVGNPDKIIKHEPEDCEECGKSLLEKNGSISGKRQVLDIPPIVPVVVEHQQITKECDCGHCSGGLYPDHINAPVQFGRNIQSFLIYLHIVGLIPYQRLQQLCEDLFQVTICKKSIENVLERGYQRALPLYERIMNIVKGCLWVGSDETGYRVSGKRWWMWVWQGLKAVYYVVSPGRGYKVVKENFGEDYQGILIHDCYSAHNNTKAKGGHQQCHSHLDRDAQYLIDTYRSKWGYQLQELLLASQRARSKIYEPGFDPVKRAKVIEEYESKLSELIKTPLKGKKNLRLQKRLRKHQKAILFFMYFPDVPFENNSSERAIRMAKVKQKISGCHRSQHGADRQAVLLSVMETAKRQNLNLFSAIKALLNGTLTFSET
jgi:transposase